MLVVFTGKETHSMIVRALQEIVGTEREVKGPTWTSRRLVLAEEKVGFSSHEVHDENGVYPLLTEEDQ